MKTLKNSELTSCKGGNRKIDHGSHGIGTHRAPYDHGTHGAGTHRAPIDVPTKGAGASQ